jgi:anhydro-N-acetylmuramic acid kinase
MAFLGLISGTSADAIDAVAVRFDGDRPTLLAARALAWPPALRHQLLELAQGDGRTSLDALGDLDQAVADAFADAALAVMAQAALDPGAVEAIGSHGQTVWHRPSAARPFTVQLGDPSRIAERTGCRVVADFRRRDIAAGGQGAPLMSAFHAAVLARSGEHRAVLNLGGIANLTVLPADPAQPVRGFDTGPASALLDAWAQRHLGAPIDRDGAFAASGRVVPTLLDALLDEPWFAQPAPKSTGREVLNLDWLARHGDLAALAPADVQATLVELSARTVADALRREASATGLVLACGGGVHNPVLMAALARALAPAALASTAALGVDPDYVEATGFAWLARQTLAGRSNNLPSVTGARGPRVLGGVYPA